jgi:hypothetical protein
LPYVSSWAYSSENVLALACESTIEYFGFCSAGFGLHGATTWSSSNQKPLSPGIALAFVCPGGFDPVPKTKADQDLPAWFHTRAPVACIIDTIGSRLREEVSSLMQNLLSIAQIGV